MRVFYREDKSILRRIEDHRTNLKVTLLKFLYETGPYDMSLTRVHVNRAAHVGDCIGIRSIDWLKPFAALLVQCN